MDARAGRSVTMLVMAALLTLPACARSVSVLGTSGTGSPAPVSPPGAGPTFTATPALPPPPTTTPSLPPVNKPTAVPTSASPRPTATVGGTVRDAAGRPVAGGYVIGLASLTVARTDSAGHYTMPCQHEALVAATWLVQVLRAGHTGTVLFGTDTTASAAIPSAPGPGYRFSGGASDAGHASPAACDGRPADFVLPPGGTVDITLLTSQGLPIAPGAGGPIDNLYLPGLGAQASLALAPVTSAGHQVLSQLGPGSLRIDGVTSVLSCSGPGVVADPTVAGARVTVVSGQVVAVTCRVG